MGAGEEDAPGSAGRIARSGFDRHFQGPDFWREFEAQRRFIIHAIGPDPKDGRLRDLEGKLTPEQFGKTTLWQMVNLYGFRRSTSQRLSTRDALYARLRQLGWKESEIYSEWQRRKADLERGARGRRGRHG